MKALTVYEPWASLIILGAKPWEWRGHELPRYMVDVRAVIHASRRPVKRPELVELLDDLKTDPLGTSLIPEIAIPFLERALRHGYPFRLGYGLGAAVFRAPIAAATWAAEHNRVGLDSDRIDHSKWAWPLTDLEPFAHPIACRGLQGFWTWDPLRENA
jgi:hypothetical protein